MNISEDTFTEWQLYEWEVIVDTWFFYGALIFLAFELLRLLFKKKLTRNILGDAVTNYVTLIMFIGINIFLIGLYLVVYYSVYEYFSIIQIPINLWTMILCIVLADIAYYWEHRFTHRCGIGWATHTVHHSSPYFNISVAYRFGPLDGIIPLFFHVPLVLIGFHPAAVIFSEMLVLAYQTALHTEVIKKFPRPIESVMNTPSHHRVHHGANPQYIDKNYAGMFIIWDKLFGTFEEEKEKVVYGIVPPLNSINPLKVFFHGLTGLAGKMWRVKGFKNKLLCLVKPPSYAESESASSGKSRTT